MKQLLPVVAVSLAAILGIGCQKSSSTSPTPQFAQIGGVWGVTLTLTSVTGGECFAALFQSAVGTVQTGTLQVTQNGSSLNAVYTSDTDGGTTTYQGTAGALSVALNGTECSACNIVGATCANGARRDLRIQTSGINATVSGNTATGTSAETYNIFVAGTDSSVGILTTNASFTATRR